MVISSSSAKARGSKVAHVSLLLLLFFFFIPPPIVVK